MHPAVPFLALSLCALASARTPGDPGAPTASLSLRLPQAAAPAGALRLEGGPPGGMAWLTLADGRRRAPAGSPVGAVLAALRLDASGTFELPLSDEAFRLGAPLGAFVLAPGAGWDEVVTVPPISLPLASGANALLTQQSGEFVITEFMKDPTQVPDTRGEWVEIYNASGTAIDVEGWVLSDEGSDRAVLDNQGAGIVVAPYAYLVLGRELDPALNGGVTVHVRYSGMTLSNGADEVILSRPNGRIVDSIRYDDGVSWPDEPGRSIALAPLATNCFRNDRGARWCPSTAPLAAGGADSGTPGAVNDPCR